MNSNKQDDENILRLPDIEIGRSLGAKIKNFDILLPDGNITQLTEGTRITNIEVIAGKGKNRKIDIIDILVDKYGGNPNEWQKIKGIGYIDDIDNDGESCKTELHWYQEPVVGKVEWKIKLDKGGNWYVDK